MRYRCIAFAAVPYGSGRASMRALYCLYCFFCSSDPVRVSIHFAAMSVLSFGLFATELFNPFREEAPRPPELFELLLTAGVERVHLARRPFLGRDLVHVDEPLLLDPDEYGVDGAFDEVGETLLSQARRDLVAVRRMCGEDRQHHALERSLEHLRHLVAHRFASDLLCVGDYR